jgi:hypothetical protein
MRAAFLCLIWKSCESFPRSDRRFASRLGRVRAHSRLRHPDLSDMEAHCLSRAGGQGWRLSHRRRRPGRLRATAEHLASALAFYNCRFPFAGGGHAKTIHSSRIGARSQDPAIMRLSVGLRYFQRALLLLRDGGKVWCIAILNVLTGTEAAVHF